MSLPTRARQGCGPPRSPRPPTGLFALGALALGLALVTAMAAFGQQPGEAAGGTGSSPQAESGKPSQKKDNKKQRKAGGRAKRAHIREATAALPERYQRWLQEVELLISEDELLAFLEIEQDYQREAFIERFWRARDPYQDSPRNEFRERWYARLEEALELFGDLSEDRAHYLLLNGLPTARIEFTCTTVVHPMEVWFYRRSEKVGYEFFLIFVRRYGERRYSLWRPTDDPRALFESGAGSRGQATMQDLYTCKDGDVVTAALARVMRNPMDYDMLLARIEEPAENPSPEWVATFAAYSTDLPEGSEELPAKLEVTYPARYRARTVTEITIQVRTDEVGTADLAGAKSYNFFLTGEILREGGLFENFRYRFDFPTNEVSGEVLPMVFERRLRPGDYTLVVKLEDLNSHRALRHEQSLDVPRVESSRRPVDEETQRVLDEAETAIGSDVPTLRIVPPRGEMQTGMVRFDTLTTGDGIAEVRFVLNDDAVVQKRRPPYSVELDLGRVPRTHTLRVSAHDEDGVELASDELTLNAGRNTFSVRFVEPQPGESHSDLLQARIDVKTPEGTAVERLELYLNETLLATLYQPPFDQKIQLPPDDQLAYVRAVAYLPDGNTTEDLVYINAPDYLEIVDIQYVELYTTALDKAGRPVPGLTDDDFSVFEDGAEQTVRRFEQVDNLPIFVQVLIDVSASMEDDIEQTKLAALEFFESAIQPKDRAALITFNDHPFLAVDFTNDTRSLAGGLAGLKAERGTSLYDSLIFGLYFLNGIKGQRAILLLSDGKDESSRFSFEDTLEYARRAGVALYAIGLNISGKGSGLARNKLEKLADETGGRAFFIKESTELGGVYQQIQAELRSRYLITYQSSNSEAGDRFRVVEIATSAPGVTVKTIRGYYP